VQRSGGQRRRSRGVELGRRRGGGGPSVSVQRRQGGGSGAARRSAHRGCAEAMRPPLGRGRAATNRRQRPPPRPTAPRLWLPRPAAHDAGSRVNGHHHRVQSSTAPASSCRRCGSRFGGRGDWRGDGDWGEDGVADWGCSPRSRFSLHSGKERKGRRRERARVAA
jgi:hypothetical protein